VKDPLDMALVGLRFIGTVSVVGSVGLRVKSEEAVLNDSPLTYESLASSGEIQQHVFLKEDFNYSAKGEKNSISFFF
jgi:hypothetical protein